MPRREPSRRRHSENSRGIALSELRRNRAAGDALPLARRIRPHWSPSDFRKRAEDRNDLPDFRLSRLKFAAVVDASNYPAVSERTPRRIEMSATDGPGVECYAGVPPGVLQCP